MMTFSMVLYPRLLDAGAEAQQFGGDVLGAEPLVLAGKARLGADADDCIEPLVFLARDLGQTLLSFLHVDMTGAAFGLALALVENSHLGTEQRGQKGCSFGHFDRLSRRHHSKCRHFSVPRLLLLDEVIPKVLVDRRARTDIDGSLLHRLDDEGDLVFGEMGVE